MSTYYIFVSRDVLSHGKKSVLTYRKIDEPGWIAGLFGRPTKSRLVRFVGCNHDWVTYPDNKPCPSGLIEMLHTEDSCQRAKHGDLDVRAF